MARRKSRLFIASLLTILSFSLIVWASCNKGGVTPVRCEGVVCENGGYCYVDTFTQKPYCTCPTGYEGPNCATVSVAKYIGTWNMQQIIKGSDTTSFINDTSYYVVSLANSSTPTTFFINNFVNNPYYTEIVCTLDSTNSFGFVIDTLSDDHMLFSSFKLQYGSGAISSNGSVITGQFAMRQLTATSNWVNDTVSFTLTHH